MSWLTQGFEQFNDQVLKMVWLSDLVKGLVEGLFGLSIESRIGGSIHFFLYDTIKILILLSVLIFFISLIQSYFPPERTRRILGRFGGVGANFLGALLGTVTPFCSCSSIPLFIGFTSAGLSPGVTFSFLISSPLVDLASVILLASIFNWQIALLYVLVGIVLATVGGTIIGRLKPEKDIESFVFGIQKAAESEQQMRWRDRLSFSWQQVREIFGRVWLYVLIGVGIGAAIHNWIPTNLVLAVFGQDKFYSVPLATLAGAPLYADIFGTLPIAEALVAKGVGLGTVLALMMAVTTLSLPSLVMLRKVVKPRLLAIFTGIVLAGILLIGYGFNLVGRNLI